MRTAAPEIAARYSRSLYRTERPADWIRVGQDFRNSLPVLRERIRMAFGDVALPLLTELDLTLEVGKETGPSTC